MFTLLIEQLFIITINLKKNYLKKKPPLWKILNRKIISIQIFLTYLLILFQKIKLNYIKYIIR
jgi:hypothetical protein